MAADADKWSEFTTGGEVAGGLLEARLSNLALYEALAAILRSDREKAVEALQRFSQHDSGLRQAIDQIGGLEEIRKGSHAAG